jgi:hypothetical protein
MLKEKQEKERKREMKTGTKQLRARKDCPFITELSVLSDLLSPSSFYDSDSKKATIVCNGQQIA